MSLYILYRGFLIAGESGWGRTGFLADLPAKVEELAADTYNGILTRETETEIGKTPQKSLVRRVVDGIFPPVEKEEDAGCSEKSEDREESTKSGVLSETEEPGSLEGLNGSEEPGSSKGLNGSEEPGASENSDKSEADSETAKMEDSPASSTSVLSNLEIPIPDALSMRQSPVTLPWASMDDFNFLLNSYFTLDMSTTIDEELLNIKDLMDKDLTIDADTDGPQILIYHTHSQEAFIDSRTGDIRDTIVGVGERLKEILEEQYGFSVLHHTKVYDMIDGKLDRNHAYNLAEPDIAEILDFYPSIQVVIDLHRDGVDGYKFVTEFNGKPTAMIMFYNGLSRTARNGEVTYLPNPYIADNLALSFQLQMKAAEYYPGFTRNIYLQSLRYNQHLCSKSLLIESGTQLNTVEEEYNAMEPLADILNQVLRGE